MGILARSICGVLMRDEQDASDGKKRRVGKPADAVRQDVDYDRGTNHHDANQRAANLSTKRLEKTPAEIATLTKTSANFTTTHSSCRRIQFNLRVNEIQLSRGGSVAGRCQRYLSAAGSNRTFDRQDETSE